MAPLAIVKYFDVLEDRGSRFTPSPESVVMDLFVFERTEETLSDRIVITVAAPTHAGDHPVLFEYGQISRARVLPTLIGMMDQPGFHPALE